MNLKKENEPGPWPIPQFYPGGIKYSFSSVILFFKYLMIYPILSRLKNLYYVLFGLFLLLKTIYF